MENSPLTVAFAVDAMLGRVARYLLHAGYDCFYADDINDEELSRVARTSERVLITRDRDFVRDASLSTEAYVIRDLNLRRSLTSLSAGFNLTFHQAFFFTRCSRCNLPVEEATSPPPRDEIPEETADWIDTYYRCENCGKWYWKGSHHEHIIEKLREWNLLTTPP